MPLVNELISVFILGALKCEVPKNALRVMLERLELLFFIDSRPVVGLIFILICNLTLYLLLILVAVRKSLSSPRFIIIYSGTSKDTSEI